MAKLRDHRPSNTRWVPWAIVAGLFAIGLVFVTGREQPVGPPPGAIAEQPAQPGAFSYLGEQWVPDPDARAVQKPDREMVVVGRLDGRQVYGDPLEPGGGGGGQGIVNRHSVLYLREGENRYVPLVRRQR